MPTLTVAEAQARLPQLVAALKPGEEVVLTAGDRPVARLVPAERPRQRPGPGLCKGMMTLPAVEDDDHLRDFAEYMP